LGGDLRKKGNAWQKEDECPKNGGEELKFKEWSLFRQRLLRKRGKGVEKTVKIRLRTLSREGLKRRGKVSFYLKGIV